MSNSGFPSFCSHRIRFMISPMFEYCQKPETYDFFFFFSKRLLTLCQQFLERPLKNLGLLPCRWKPFGVSSLAHPSEFSHAGCSQRKKVGALKHIFFSLSFFCCSYNLSPSFLFVLLSSVFCLNVTLPPNFSSLRNLAVHSFVDHRSTTPIYFRTSTSIFCINTGSSVNSLLEYAPYLEGNHHHHRLGDSRSTQSGLFLWRGLQRGDLGHPVYAGQKFISASRSIQARTARHSHLTAHPRHPK